MGRGVTEHTRSRWVYTSGTDHVATAVPSSGQSREGMGSKAKQLDSYAGPLPSQILTFQRGLARAAIARYPAQRDQIRALAEVLGAMGLLHRYYET